MTASFVISQIKSKAIICLSPPKKETTTDVIFGGLILTELSKLAAQMKMPKPVAHTAVNVEPRWPQCGVWAPQTHGRICPNLAQKEGIPDHWYQNP